MPMKRIFLLLALLPLFAPALRAQDVRKHYTSLATEKGTLYFVYPRKLAATGASGGKASLPFDLTYLTSADSLSFTVSLRVAGSGAVDSVHVVAPDGAQLSVVPERIYVDARRSGYEHRLRFGIPFEAARRLYEGASPYVLRFFTADGVCAYAFKAGAWNKERAVMRRIFGIFEMNR